MPPRGFEPLISALKGRRPRPLDDGGSGRCVGRGTLGRDGARKGYQIERKACRVESRHTTKRPRLSSRPSLGSGSWIRTNDLRVMSPTSYHCSIPRYVHRVYHADEWLSKGERPWHRPIVPGGCPPSIVGAGAFHDRVREGNGWGHPAGATEATLALVGMVDVRRSWRPGVVPEGEALSPRPLVPLRSTRCRASTRGLSTRWSTWGLTSLTEWGPSSPGELPA